MKIGINASFIRKIDSGTGQVTKHFLDALFLLTKENDQQLSDLEFVLYFEKESNLDLPANFSKKVLVSRYKRDDLIRKIWWEKYLLPQEVERDGCDILFSLYQSPTVTKSAKHVMLVHDVVWKKFPQYLNNFRKKIYYAKINRAIKKADCIMTVSKFSKKDIEKFYGINAEKIVVNYNDCDPIFKQEYSQEKIAEVLDKHNLQSGYIFYVGGFDIRKNVERLIEAYGLMWQKHHEYTEIPKLVLAGSFYPHLIPLITDVPNCIRRASEKYKMPENKIEIIGFAKQEELPMLYHGASLFCYPSLLEGFGLPVLEAMNCGCSVVTSKTSSIPEVTGDGSAWLVDPEDEKAIGEAMFEALTNMQKREGLRAGAKEQAKKFEWERFAKKFITTINEVSK